MRLVFWPGDQVPGVLAEAWHVYIASAVLHVLPLQFSPRLARSLLFSLWFF